MIGPGVIDLHFAAVGREPPGLLARWNQRNEEVG
jgi:hypothetical protein